MTLVTVDSCEFFEGQTCLCQTNELKFVFLSLTQIIRCKYSSRLWICLGEASCACLRSRRYSLVDCLIYLLPGSLKLEYHPNFLIYRHTHAENARVKSSANGNAFE